MAMQDKSTVTLTAVDGIYDIKARHAHAQPGNPDRLDRGLSGPPDEAKVEIKKGRIVSEKPVQLKMPQGTLDANRWKSSIPAQ